MRVYIGEDTEKIIIVFEYLLNSGCVSGKSFCEEKTVGQQKNKLYDLVVLLCEIACVFDDLNSVKNIPVAGIVGCSIWRIKKPFSA